jgi:subtilisin
MEFAMAEQFILLPAHGLKAFQSDGPTFDLLVGVGHASSIDAPLSFQQPQATVLPEPVSRIKVLDSIHEDGPKLIEAEPQEIEALEHSNLGVRVRPLISYRVALPNQFKPDFVTGASSGPPATVRVISAQNATPIRDALVTAFTDFANNLGAEALTDSNGDAFLNLGGLPVNIDRLYVQPPLHGFWGACCGTLVLPNVHHVQLRPVDLSVPDALRHFYPPGPGGALEGKGVVVAVVDTGIGPHADLVVDQTWSENTAKGEPSNLWEDNGTGHGTHVAGIISARGMPPHGLSGLAPEVQLRSYRAFRASSLQTTNYQLMKAIMHAVDHGCHIINLSVAGENRSDDTFAEALEDARDHGALVVAAAGNGGRKPVSYPAGYAYSTGLSVSAMGRLGTFPPTAFEECHVDSPKGVPDADNFVARFSNVGNVSLTGPGVGVLSTVPGGYGPMSGTSMACPVVAGMAARLLARDLATNGVQAILNLAPDKARSLRMISLGSKAARKLGFGMQFEGDGLVQ